MSPGSPARAESLFLERWRALKSNRSVQGIYLVYLLVQAAALVIWWPKGTLTDALAEHDGPDPLLAVLVVHGVSTAYCSLRLGAEDLAFPDQSALLEHIQRARSLARLLLGWLAAHLLSLSIFFLWALPVQLAAFSVSSASREAYLGCLGAAALGATFFVLVGGLLRLTLSPASVEGEAQRFVALRVLFFFLYFPVFYVYEPASQIALFFALLRPGGSSAEPGLDPGAGPAPPEGPALIHFAAAYGIGTLVLAAAWIVRARRLHRSHRFRDQAV